MRCHFIPVCAFVLSCLVGFASPAVMADSPAAIADKFVEAWNSHDKSTFVALFTENAYWVPVVDVRLDGRRNIVDDLGKAHESWARSTTMRASDVATRQVSPDVAIVLLHAAFLDKDGQQSAPGNALLLVVVEQVDGWRIAAGQLTKPGSTKMPQP